MLVEYVKSPLAIGTRKPRFSWQVPLEGRSRSQSAYQILVATSRHLLEAGKADMWDSGKVDSSQSVNVDYGGLPLCSNRDYVWTVQVWDESGMPNGFCRPEAFGTALLDEADWQAQWIGMGATDEPEFHPYSMQQADATSGGLRLADDDFQLMDPAFREFTPERRSPQLRKPFKLTKPVKRARAFVSGMGLFEFRLNGAKVGDDVLNTPRTDYRKRTYFFTYDVTDKLSEGDNVMGVILGGGWYNAQKKYWHWQAPWFGSPRALVQLEVAYADGSADRLVSDDSWKGDGSPISLSCIYDGEDYDARQEQPGWDSPAFDASQWKPVNLVSPPGGVLTALDLEPNKVMKRFAPVSVVEPEPGVFVFDMGTVMTGWAALRIPQGSRGETVILRYAELQHTNGMVNASTGGGARQADHYIMKGTANECYEPRFTYHGFRYVEVTGYPGKPTLDTLEACFVHNGVQQAGAFECGHELINKIHACTLQSQRCNMQMGVPTDDTQREERLGWCGDAWSYAKECFYNLDAARFWTKWIADFYDQQNDAGLVGFITPLSGFGEDLVWSAAFPFITWWHYIHYGDKRILENSYPYLKKYIAYLEKVGRTDIPALPANEIGKALFPETSIADRMTTPENHGYLQRSRFGDHLATNEGASGMGKDQPRSLATAFYHYDIVMMIRIAETLGHADDAQTYRDLAGKIKAAFNDYFFDAASGFYDVGCQSAQAVALCFDLVPDDQRQRVQGYLNSSVNFRQRRITSGYAGTKWVVDALGKSGRNDILWNRATSTDYPSWGFMLAENKTTITENWHGAASQCHTTLGAAIDEWFYWGLAGIRSDETGPGFERIIIQPYLPLDLPWCKATLDTARGTIVSDWKHDGSRARLRVTVPANSTATIVLSTSDNESVTEGDQPVDKVADVKRLKSEASECVFEVGSGDYCFGFCMAG